MVLYANEMKLCPFQGIKFLFFDQFKSVPHKIYDICCCDMRMSATSLTFWFIILNCVMQARPPRAFPLFYLLLHESQMTKYCCHEVNVILRYMICYIWYPEVHFIYYMCKNATGHLSQYPLHVHCVCHFNANVTGPFFILFYLVYYFCLKINFPIDHEAINTLYNFFCHGFLKTEIHIAKMFFCHWFNKNTTR